jgi:hypothetical protein
MATVITIGSDAVANDARHCGCPAQPDMTAFGFVTNPKPNCDRDLIRKGEDSKVQGAYDR